MVNASYDGDDSSFTVDNRAQSYPVDPHDPVWSVVLDDVGDTAETSSILSTQSQDAYTELVRIYNNVFAHWSGDDADEAKKVLSSIIASVQNIAQGCSGLEVSAVQNLAHELDWLKHSWRHQLSWVERDTAVLPGFDGV